MPLITTIERAARHGQGQLEAAELARRLRRRLEGDVRFDAGSRALYATDGSNYRQVPIGVVVPRHADDVVAAIELCRHFEAPVLPRGAGTSLAALLHRKGRTEAAHELLAPICERITQGFQTPDVRAATALLGRLSASVR